MEDITKKQPHTVKSETTDAQPAKEPSVADLLGVETAFTPAKKAVAKTSTGKKKKKKKQVRSLPQGKVFVHATYNNTIVTFTDLQGNAVAASSAGKMGFRGPKKSTPYAASVVVRDAVDHLAPFGMKEVRAFVKGIGAGREGAIRALHAQGLNVTAIKDITPMPHNGCRPPKPRRI
ncbi:MAG: 30S ribosomal protein S11 [Parcubacteria group bacterium CG08_land_8_20_14_0_20_48_21]|nr:MAG: 30S ribosomal protein S11 [Parcubacteria group bacterium CG08_land_8_20_14_0_20_48_21]PIZ77999.1 MAG: 30S ribosomal protein S11 [bacterium CG_4_10_14_0_2_um_filter_48_144]PJE52811.1 MAG: 30S ribosomal protein S11 [Parcubacteria group bacterium CG11_big_fil_rev_8_21_14_0_20_48_46]